MLFGAFVLHVFIECNPQYSIPFMFAMMLPACAGIQRFFSEKRAYEKRFTESLLVLNIIGTIILATTCIEYYPAFVEYVRNREVIVAGQGYKNTSVALENSNMELVQSFETEKDFSCIKVGVNILDNNLAGDQYRFVLLNQNEEILYETNFGIEDVSGSYVVFELPKKISVENNEKYFLKLEMLENAMGVPMSFQCETRKLDYYSKGTFMVGEQFLEDYDLTFFVTDINATAYWGNRSYYGIWNLIIGISLVTCIYLFFESHKRVSIEMCEK